MINLDELARGGTLCTTQSGVKMNSGTNKYEVELAAPNGAGTDFGIEGILYHKADAADIAVTAAAIQPVLTTCLYLICLNAAGTLSTVKGTAVLSADLAAGSEVLHWPAPLVDTCVIGAVKVALASTATFTAATTAFNASNVTSTFYSLLAVPVAPMTS